MKILELCHRYCFAALAMTIIMTLPAPARAEISGNFYSGAVRIGPTPLACDSAAKGAIRYDETNNIHEYCNGTNWLQLLYSHGTGGPPSLPVAGDGYFVVTNGLWNGNADYRVRTQSALTILPTTTGWARPTPFHAAS